MEEYQVTVSVNGEFLFRTEWSLDKERTDKIINLFATRLGINVVVRCMTRPAAVVETEYRMV
jgi:hypothetical protein